MTEKEARRDDDVTDAMTVYRRALAAPLAFSFVGDPTKSYDEIGTFAPLALSFKSYDELGTDCSYIFAPLAFSLDDRSILTALLYCTFGVIKIIHCVH